MYTYTSWNMKLFLAAGHNDTVRDAADQPHVSQGRRGKVAVGRWTTHSHLAKFTLESISGQLQLD